MIIDHTQDVMCQQKLKLKERSTGKGNVMCQQKLKLKAARKMRPKLYATGAESQKHATLLGNSLKHLKPICCVGTLSEVGLSQITII